MATEVEIAKRLAQEAAEELAAARGEALTPVELGDDGREASGPAPGSTRPTREAVEEVRQDEAWKAFQRRIEEPRKQPVMSRERATAQLDQLRFRIEQRRSMLHHSPSAKDRQRGEERVERMELEYDRLFYALNPPFTEGDETPPGEPRIFCRHCNTGLTRHEAYERAGQCSACYSQSLSPKEE